MFRKTAMLGMLTAGWLAFSATAVAATNPPLTGETLVGTPTLVAANCNETGNSTFTYRVTGVATGAYPGTFEETVTVTVGPQTEQTDHPIEGLAFGPIVQLHATFRIDSPAGTVTGTKELVSVPGAFPASEHGVCDDESLDAPPGCTATFFQADTLTRYRARITSSLGTSTDSGTAWLAGGGIQTTCGGDVLHESGSFTQAFLISTGPFLPTAKEQCKNGGFADFGVFKNQGECVAFVATGGRNEPGKNR